jgi:hypothetical protein
LNVVVVEAVDSTPYGKPALRKGRLPTGLGKPAAGLPQLHSFDDDELILLIYTLTGYRGTFTDQQLPRALLFVKGVLSLGQYCWIVINNLAGYSLSFYGRFYFKEICTNEVYNAPSHPSPVASRI